MSTPRSADRYGQPSFSLIPFTSSRAFCARSYHEPAYQFLWHYHPEWEITFTRNGRGTRHVGASVEQFGPGDLVMVPGNVPHTWFSGPDQVGYTRCTVIQYQPKVWGDRFWEVPEMAVFRGLCNRARRGICFCGEGVEAVGAAMEALALRNPHDVKSIAAVIGIFDMLTRLDVRLLHADDGERSEGVNLRLQELLGWIEKHLTEPLEQRGAAARMKMSSAGFSRWFKSQTGCVFQRYVNEMRVAKVCTSLAFENCSITEAAFRAGYNNLSNFNRRFYDVTGLTPKAFRRQFPVEPWRKTAREPA